MKDCEAGFDGFISFFRERAGPTEEHRIAMYAVWTLYFVEREVLSR